MFCGKKLGVYWSWQDCTPQVIWVKRSLQKPFDSESEVVEAFQRVKGKGGDETGIGHGCSWKKYSSNSCEVIEVQHAMFYTFTHGFIYGLKVSKEM